MFVKVCGLNNPSNILEIEQCNPELVGFIFYDKSPRFFTGISLPKSKAKKVGVFVNSSIEFIEAMSLKHELDFIQLHGNESNNEIKNLHQLGYKIIKAVSIHSTLDIDDLIEFAPYCSYFLFDTKGSLPGGNGIKFNWEILDQYTLTIPFILSGGIKLEDLSEIKRIKHTQFAGVDINSGFELSPGIKNKELVKTFINEIRK